MQEKIIKDELDCFFGARLDVFLHAKFVDMSRSLIQEKVKNGLVLLNEKVVKNSVKLDKMDKITILDDFFEEKKQDFSEIKSFAYDLDIVFEDENLLIINKPFGMSTHTSRFENEKTLVNALVFKFSKHNLSDIAGADRLGIVHRLDKQTSGLIVVAKNNESHAKLSEMLKEKIDFKRKYLAICHRTPVPSSGVVEKFMKKGDFEDKKMVLCDEDDRFAKFSKTKYKVVKTFLDGAFSLIEFELDTGRTHQIRLHALSMGNPVVGDRVYFSKKSLVFNEEIRSKIKTISGQMLCSYFLSIIHPINDEYLEFSIDLPKEMLDFIEVLKK